MSGSPNNLFFAALAVIEIACRPGFDPPAGVPDAADYEDIRAVMPFDEAPGIAVILARMLREVLDSHGKDPQEWCDAVRRA
ncbi:hypothetical protein [Mycobacterium colombiense]|uniref:hypothetical protein n=1 Tax=Mycobacterium colombiense TaxID=339268 RepID=UPI00115426D7|nr:hypothetical protein [Mycobacterium colombiense]